MLSSSFSVNNAAVSLTMKYSLASKWRILFEKTPEWIPFKPQPGLTVYSCYCCKTMFSSKPSFQDHINRRVIVIKYNCSQCSSALTFYNRCAFILHTRTHFSSQEGKINLTQVDIYLLPLGLAGFSRHNGIPYLYDEDDILFNESFSVNSQFYTPNEMDIGKSIVTMKPQNLVFYYNNPPEPKVRLVLRQIAKNVPLCRFIDEKYLNKEMALIEIKQEIIEDDDSTVQKSVNGNLDGKMTCPECRKAQKMTLKMHFLGSNKPLDESLVCYVCKFIAPTKCSLQAHIRIHTNAAPHVCPDCGQTFNTATKLLSHMEEICYHLTKQIRFKCSAPKCGKLFVLSKTYATHFTNHLHSMQLCDICNEVFQNTLEFDYHVRNNHSSEKCQPKTIYSCRLCKEEKILQQNYKSHIEWHVLNRQRCVYIYACKLCRSHFRSTATYAVHRAKCSNKSLNNFINTKCLYCGNLLTFRDRDTYKSCHYCRQINYFHKTTENDISTLKSGTVCILCKEEITDNQQTHLKICKYNNPIVKLNRDQTVNGTDSDSGINKRKRSDSNPSSVKSRKTDEEPQIDGLLKCLSCNAKYFDRSEFHKHIITHRDVSTAYQCMECGECFVVKPSLVKHLIHCHKISDVDEYFQQNDCFNRSAIEELENHIKLIGTTCEYSGPVKENQCRVCFKEFDCAFELDKHFRIHGMAYLMKKSK